MPSHVRANNAYRRAAPVPAFGTGAFSRHQQSSLALLAFTPTE